MNTKDARKTPKSAKVPVDKKTSVDSLEPCDKPHVAEATRTKEVDEACDDGVH